ncbi:4'-phosphopantetheinyl transferase family protein [Streptomyces alkaliphilus]|uniref:4'-phosphopantetheinyl transferase family protein n=1 Tax=Streptomyces alkaliphilus TaxID=1472722 RepID=UPI001565B250
MAGTSVRIWQGRLAEAPADEDLRLLSGEESARYRSFHSPLPAARYAGAHAALRRALGSVLGTGPAAIGFGRALCPLCGAPRHGRPVITFPLTRLHFSLSHSGADWLCAVAEGVAVGADVEGLRPQAPPELYEAVLSASELTYLARRPPQTRPVEFARCWTRKEAVMKGSGTGLAADPRRVEVHPDHGTALVRHRDAGSAPATWAVPDLPAGPGHRAAVAVARARR